MRTRMKVAFWTCLVLLMVSPGVAPRRVDARAEPARVASEQPPRVDSGGLEAVSASEGLARAVRDLARRSRGALWAGYSMLGRDGDHEMCCFDSISSRCCGRCRLEESDSFNMNVNDDKKVTLEGPERFFVLFRMEGGSVQKIRPFSEGCEMDAGRLPFFWLTGVSADESLRWLASFVTGEDASGEDDLTEHSLAAIAAHGDPGADRVLEKFVAKGQPQEVREHAAFWMGVARGRAGYDVLIQLVRDDPSTEMRKKAIFALSQSQVPEATDTLIRVARSDRESDVRGEALFWLAQKAGRKAAETLTDAIENDPETEVKKKAVFAMTQLPDDEGVPLLIRIARENRNPQVRKEAIFWLGQSGDPRALDFIESILNG